MVEAAIQTLAASGPLAILMGLVIVVLWKENRRLVAKYEGDPGDAKTPATPGVVANMTLAAQRREDDLRKHAEKRFDEERKRGSEDLQMLNETLKGYAEE